MYDDRGDVPGIRCLSVTELARISGLDDEDTLSFLLRCSSRDAHRFLGNAIPSEAYYHLYDSIQQSLRPPDVLNPTGQPIDDDVPMSQRWVRGAHTLMLILTRARARARTHTHKTYTLSQTGVLLCSRI